MPGILYNSLVLKREYIGALFAWKVKNMEKKMPTISLGTKPFLAVFLLTHLLSVMGM